MYSDDTYLTNMPDHSGLIIYTALFAVILMAAVLKIVFHNATSEYVHAD